MNITIENVILRWEFHKDYQFYLYSFWYILAEFFEKIAESNPEVMSLSFVHDLDFIASEYLVTRFAKTLERVVKVMFEWEKYNAITYNIAKIEVVNFF